MKDISFHTFLYILHLTLYLQELEDLHFIFTIATMFKAATPSVGERSRCNSQFIIIRRGAQFNHVHSAAAPFGELFSAHFSDAVFSKWITSSQHIVLRRRAN